MTRNARTHRVACSSWLEHADIDIDAPAHLSPAARARRDAMLAHLQGAVVRTARRRRATRAAVAVCPPALALLVAITFLRTSPVPQSTVHNPAPHDPATSVSPTSDSTVDAAHSLAAVMRHADFQIIEAPPSARIITSAPANVRIISDDELIETLRATGRDVGLIRMPDRVILTDNTPDDGSSSRAPDLSPARATGSV